MGKRTATSHEGAAMDKYNNRKAPVAIESRDGDIQSQALRVGLTERFMWEFLLDQPLLVVARICGEQGRRSARGNVSFVIFGIDGILESITILAIL